MGNCASCSSKYEQNYNNERSKSSSELKVCIGEWERGKSETMLLNGKSIDGTIPGGDNIGKPVFQFLPVKSLHDGGTMVMESQNCRAIIPAGFRDAPTVNTMNPVRYEIGRLSALMSILHVVVIPKETRIYNATTLNSSHKNLLLEMRQLGCDAITKLIRADVKLIGSLKWQLTQNKSITMKDGNVYNTFIKMSDMSSTGRCKRNLINARGGKLSDNFIIDSIRHYFHVGESASIGYLHLHSTADCFNTIARDIMEDKAKSCNFIKNTPFDEIIKLL